MTEFKYITYNQLKKKKKRTKPEWNLVDVADEIWNMKDERWNFVSCRCVEQKLMIVEEEETKKNKINNNKTRKA